MATTQQIMAFKKLTVNNIQNSTTTSMATTKEVHKVKTLSNSTKQGPKHCNNTTKQQHNKATKQGDNKVTTKQYKSWS
jgi:hypothetical protein